MGRTTIVRALSGLMVAASLVASAGTAAHAAAVPFHKHAVGTLHRAMACNMCFPETCKGSAPLMICRGSVPRGLRAPEGIIVMDDKGFEGSSK